MTKNIVVRVIINFFLLGHEDQWVGRTNNYL
jgi:hypothetical protein